MQKYSKMKVKLNIPDSQADPFSHFRESIDADIKREKEKQRAVSFSFVSILLSDLCWTGEEGRGV